MVPVTTAADNARMEAKSSYQNRDLSGILYQSVIVIATGAKARASGLRFLIRYILFIEFELYLNHFSNLITAKGYPFSPDKIYKIKRCCILVVVNTVEIEIPAATERLLPPHALLPRQGFRRATESDLWVLKPSQLEQVSYRE